MRPNPGRAIVAGFAAMTAMTLALYVLVSVLAGQPWDSAMLGGAVVWMSAMVLQFVAGVKGMGAEASGRGRSSPGARESSSDS